VIKIAKQQQEESVGRVRLPRRNELEQFAIAVQLMGANQIKTVGEDGEERITRIPGKLKKRVWIRENDVVIIKVWDFQPTKADVVWRYLPTQTAWLRRKGHLKNLPV